MDPGFSAHLHDWLNLLLRWAHFITGVAWIGASFYFNWLENHLERQVKPADSGAGIAGDLWAVHGGGFYYLQKYEVAPPRLPATLHWFKYEAYFTWITGFALLGSLYYMNAGVYMVDRTVADLTALAAVAIGVLSLALSWLFYDLLCRTAMRENNLVTALVVFGWFVLLASLLSNLLSGRAAYIHVGAAIGTIMVANVFFVIIPAQKELVAAVREGRAPDAGKGRNALLRSRHNNYFTLPVLFIMISNHYASTYSNALNWLVLAIIALAGVGVRHFFNIRHLDKRNRWVLPVSLLLLVVAIAITSPVGRSFSPGGLADGKEAMPAPSTAEVLPVIRARCGGCHSETPTMLGFTAPVMGLVLDNAEQLEKQAERVYQTTVVTRSMPFGNMTEMTDDERNRVATWYEARAQANE